MHNFQFTLGDWSHDGHGMTEVVHLRSNKTPKEIAKMYKEFVTKTGMAFHSGVDVDPEFKNKNIKVLFCDYDDCKISIEEVGWLGLSVKEDIFPKETDEWINKYGISDGHIYVDTDLFVEILIACLKKDNPDLVLEVQPKHQVPSLHLGPGLVGYGLFSA
jgi:hypothetical protein